MVEHSFWLLLIYFLPPWNGRLRSHAGHRDSGGPIGKGNGLFHRHVFGQGHGQGSVEHVTGSGGVYRFYRLAGNIGILSIIGQKSSFRAQRDDDVGYAFVQQLAGGGLQGVLTINPDAGEQLGFRLVGSDHKQL